MKDRWSELFGKDYYLILRNEERKYLALDPLEDKWETTSFYSKTNLWHKRTTVYWDNDVIKKVIVEQKKVSKEGKLIYHSYLENYRCPHGGVAPSIHPMLMEDETETVYAGNPYMHRYNLLNDSNREFREELFTCLGLSKDAAFDDFAGKFGGMTKAEIIQRIRG